MSSMLPYLLGSFGCRLLDAAMCTQRALGLSSKQRGLLAMATDSLSQRAY